jgi:hypothetical protein
MSRVLIIIWLLAIWQIGVWTFAPAPPKPQTPHYDGRAFGPNEDIFVESRQSMRRDAVKTLARPWSDFCTELTRKKFVSGLGEYYYQRENQIERHTETYGPAGAEYIAQQWSTADDMRIDRLTQELYSNGYLKPEMFEPVARKLVTAIIKDERVTGGGCAP